MKRIACCVMLALAVALSPVAASAQNYPSRTVSVIVPFPPGGSVDGVGRIIVDKLNQTPLGSHFIVENRAGGASGNVGANVVAKADPDGYTLLETASLHVVTPFLYKDVPFDVVKDFTPITLIAKGPLIVSTTPSVPANNLKDFFDLVRKDPQKYTFGTTSVGSASHLVVELLKREAKVDTLVVAYKGTGPALTDLMSGQIQLVADPMLSSLPQAQSGRIKALAITSLKRQAAAPEIPDDRGIRPAGLRVRVVVRIMGTEEPARGHHREAAIERRRNSGAAGGQGEARGARFRGHRFDVRRICQIHRQRNGTLRSDHSRRQYQGGVTIRPTRAAATISIRSACRAPRNLRKASQAASRPHCL